MGGSLNIGQTAKNFYNQYVTKEDKLHFALIGITLLLGTLYIILNDLFFHFTGLLYIPSLWLKLIPFVFVIMVLGMYARQLSPRMGYLTRSYGLYFFIVLSLGLLTTGIQYTPFPLIDPYLVHADKFIGFHSLAVLNWTYAHPHIKHFFESIYDDLGYQLFLVPLILAFWLDKKAVETYFLAIIFSYLIGTTIYYFFPTAGLTVVFHSPHLMPDQHDTYLKFFEAHHHIPVSTSNGGMIAFPSFHVTWSIILAYACRHKKWIFYPLAVFNSFIILSTLFLGWHYLTDVLAAFILSAVVIYFAELLYKCYFLDIEAQKSKQIKTHTKLKHLQTLSNSNL